MYIYINVHHVALSLTNSKACSMCVWTLFGQHNEMRKETMLYYISAHNSPSTENLVLAKSKCQSQAWHFTDVLTNPKA